jgi:hypothetical protein
MKNTKIIHILIYFMSLGITVSVLAKQEVLHPSCQKTEPENGSFILKKIFEVFSIITGNQSVSQEVEEEISLYDANDLVLLQAFQEGRKGDHATYRRLFSKLAPYLQTSRPEHRDPKFINKFLTYYQPGTPRWEGLEKWQQDIIAVVELVKKEWYPEEK